jgi:hypothetical protein
MLCSGCVSHRSKRRFLAVELFVLPIDRHTMRTAQIDRLRMVAVIATATFLESACVMVSASTTKCFSEDIGLVAFQAGESSSLLIPPGCAVLDLS